MPLINYSGQTCGPRTSFFTVACLPTVFSIGPTYADDDLAYEMGRESRLPKYWWPRPVDEYDCVVTLRPKDITRLQRYPRDEAYFRRRLYAEAMRQGALDPQEQQSEPEPLGHYLQTQLAGPKEATTLKATLALTDGFFCNAPQGPAADCARLAVGDAAARLSPLYARALSAVQHFQWNDKTLAHLRAITARIDTEPLRSNIFLGPYLADLKAADQQATQLLPRMMIQERAALRWALVHGRKGVDSLVAATQLFDGRWNGLTLVHLAHGGMLQRPEPKESDLVELTDQQYARLACIDEVYVRLGRSAYSTLLKDYFYPTSGFPGFALRVRAFAHAILRAHEGVDVAGMRKFLRGRTGKRYAKCLIDVQNATNQDMQELFVKARQQASTSGHIMGAWGGEDVMA